MTDPLLNIKYIPSPVKLKDTHDRGGIIVHLEKAFGFIPQRIIVQKVRNENNKVIIGAIVDPGVSLPSWKPKEEDGKKE
jgi:hypothetical protein